MARSSLWHRLQAKANREKAKQAAKVLKRSPSWRRILNLGGLSEKRRKLEKSLEIARTCLQVNEDWDILCLSCRKKIAIRRVLLKFRQSQQGHLKSLRKRKKITNQALDVGDKLQRMYEKKQKTEKAEKVAQIQKYLKRKRNEDLEKEEGIIKSTQEIIAGANRTTIEAQQNFGQGRALEEILSELEERVRKICRIEG